MKETVLKDFYGRILGFIQEDQFGNKTLRDFHRRILGKYDKATDTTRDFYGRIVARGDQLTILLNLK